MKTAIFAAVAFGVLAVHPAAFAELWTGSVTLENGSTAKTYSNVYAFDWDKGLNPTLEAGRVDLVGAQLTALLDSSLLPGPGPFQDVTLNLSFTGNGAADDTFTILDNGSVIASGILSDVLSWAEVDPFGNFTADLVGSATGTVFSPAFDGFEIFISGYDGVYDSYNVFEGSYNVLVTPEPSTLPLAALGCIGLFAAVRKRRSC